MRVPSWVRVLVMVGLAIPIVLLVVLTTKFGAGPLIFAVVVAVPIFLFGRRRSARLLARDDARWAEWERQRSGRPRDPR